MERTMPDDDDIKEVDVEQEESDIEIEVVDDTPEPDRNAKPATRDIDDPSDDELADYGEKVQKRMKELTFARHNERREKEAALREREEAVRIAQKLLDENKNLRQNVHTNQTALASTIKSKAESTLEMARKKLKEAQESYDTDAIVAAQEELTEAKFNYERVKNFKPAPLQEPEEQVYISQNTQQAPTPDSKALAWQEKNQWFGPDEEMTAFAYAVHKKLVDSGVDPRSDEYYERIDARMREVFPAQFGVKKADPKRPATVVAPATRTTGKKKVALTKTQEALARRLGLTNEQYAKEVLKLSSEA
jgi:ElaB/YqjD/DUF883 family membrane-anchored ribosome-binding protein